MGGTRWCKNCHTSHEGPTGSKCQKFDSQTQEDGAQVSLENQASSIALANKTVVSEEDARLVAQQVDVHSVINRQETSTGGKGIDAGQQLILQELKTMAKRFGALEEQTAKDREVLTDLVSQVKQQTQGQSQKKVTSVFSSQTVNATHKSTCQSNATKQRHKSGPKQFVYCHINKKDPRVKCLGGHSSPGILWTSAQSVIVSMIPILMGREFQIVNNSTGVRFMTCLNPLHTIIRLSPQIIQWVNKVVPWSHLHEL